MKKVKIKSPELHLVTAYTVSDPTEAELIKNTLLDHGIECRLAGEYQAGFTGALAVEILVRESDAEQALEFIRIHHSHSDQADQGGDETSARGRRTGVEEEQA